MAEHSAIIKTRQKMKHLKRIDFEMKVNKSLS